MSCNSVSVTFDELAQQERAAKALVRHMVNQLPVKRFTIKQRKGFLHNGVNHQAQIAGLAVWGPKHG